MKNQSVPGSADLFNRNHKLQSMQSLPPMNQPHCRICLQQTSPLIQLPCACIGELGLIHQQCFTKWIQTMRSQSTGYRSYNYNLHSIGQNMYEIPCEICKANIKIQMVQKRSCIKSEDLKKPQVVFAIVCILFNLVILAITTYFCVSSIIRSSDSGLKIFINLFILVIIYIIIGWIMKRQLKRLRSSKITNLKISNPGTPLVQPLQIQNNNNADNFIIVDDQPQSQQNQQGNRSNRSNRSNRRRRKNNRNATSNQNIEDVHIDL